MELATGIVITAGTMTFANEWWQTKQVNWRVPVATLFLGAAFDFMSKLDSKIANILAVMVFIGAGAAKFNGRSAFDTIAGIFPPQTQKKQAQPTRRVQVA